MVDGSWMQSIRGKERRCGCPSKWCSVRLELCSINGVQAQAIWRMAIAVAVQCSVRFALQVCSKSAALSSRKKAKGAGRWGWRVRWGKWQRLGRLTVCVTLVFRWVWGRVTGQRHNVGINRQRAANTTKAGCSKKEVQVVIEMTRASVHALLRNTLGLLQMSSSKNANCMASSSTSLAPACPPIQP